MSFLYTASLVPVPLVPTAPPDLAACTDTTTTAGAIQSLVQQSGLAFDPLLSNQTLAAIAAGFSYSPFGSISQGCTLATVSGLALPVAAGVVSIMGPVQVPAQNVVVPDSTTLGFIWALQTGTCTYTLTTTPPSSNCAYLGNFTTSGGNVTVVDYTGVCYPYGNSLIRTTADRSGPTDTPNAGTLFHTLTAGGHFIFNGSDYYNANPVTTAPSFNLTLTGTLQLLIQDNGFNANLVASGGDKIVLMPATASLPDRWQIGIWNVGASHNIVLKDSTGVTTLSTIAAANGIYAYAYWNGSAIVLPGSTPWTAGPRPVPSASPAS